MEIMVLIQLVKLVENMPGSFVEHEAMMNDQVCQNAHIYFYNPGVMHLYSQGHREQT